MTPTIPDSTRSRSAQIDLSFVNAAGNNRLTTLSVGERAALLSGDRRWIFSQSLDVVYGETADEVSSEQYRAGLRIDRRLGERLLVFVGGNFERNRLAGVSRRFQELAGLGWLALQTPRDLLSAEAGLALNQERAVGGAENDFTAVRAAAAYERKLTATAVFRQTLELLPNLEDTGDLRVNTETTLLAPLSTRIALKASYQIRYDAEPEPGFEKSDRILSTGLQIAL